MGALFGSSSAPVWGKDFLKAPKVNAHRERLRPALMQKAQENMADIHLNRENIRREQSHDQECSLISKYLTLGTLPESDMDTRSILLRQEHYIMIDSLLYHIFTPTSSKPGAQAQLVIPQNLKVPFLRLYHVEKNKMLSIMQFKCYWIGMSRDVREHVLSC